MGLSFFGSESKTLQTNIAPTSPVSATTGGGQTIISTPIAGTIGGVAGVGGGKKSQTNIASSTILQASGGSTLVQANTETYAPSVSVITNSPGATASTSPASASLDWKTAAMFAAVVLGAIWFTTRN